VLRGFGFSFIYYISIGTAIYLFSVKLLPREPVEKPKVPLYQNVTTSIFFGAVAYLVVLIGVLGKGELLGAVNTASWMFGVLAAVFLYFKYVRKEPALEGETLFGSFRRGVETHAEMTSYLTELLATLGIMIGLFTITGFILRMGAMMLEVGTWSIVAMVLMAYLFGWFLGTGLPPTATYIIGAVIIVPPMTKLGINPWIAHFFVFFLCLGRALAADVAQCSRLCAHCERIVHANHVGGAENLPADHGRDVCDLHPLGPGGETRLGTDWRHLAGDHWQLRFSIRDVRAVYQKFMGEYRGAHSHRSVCRHNLVPSKRHTGVGDRRHHPPCPDLGHQSPQRDCSVENGGCGRNRGGSAAARRPCPSGRRGETRHRLTNGGEHIPLYSRLNKREQVLIKRTRIGLNPSCLNQRFL